MNVKPGEIYDENDKDGEDPFVFSENEEHEIRGSHKTGMDEQNQSRSLYYNHI